MKISIGTKIKDGPWGGGNLFAINLKNYLESNGHKVFHDLDEDDIDIILITEPENLRIFSIYSYRCLVLQKFCKFECNSCTQT